MAAQVDVSSSREKAQKWLCWHLHSHLFSNSQRKKDDKTWQWMKVVADGYDERQHVWQNHANKCQGFLVNTTGPVHQFTVGLPYWLPNTQTHEALSGVWRPCTAEDYQNTKTKLSSTYLPDVSIMRLEHKGFKNISTLFHISCLSLAVHCKISYLFTANLALMIHTNEN